MMQKKLLVWHYNLLQYFNGGTKFVFTIASALAKEYRVVLIANSIDPNVVKKFRDENIEVVVNYLWPKNIYAHRLLMPFGIIFDALKSIPLMSRADNVVATAFPSNIVCFLASLITGKKYIYYCFEPTVMFFDEGFINNKKGFEKIQWVLAAKIYGFFDMLSIKYSTKVLTLTNTMVDLITKVYKVKSIPTQVGVDVSYFSPDKKSLFAKKYHNRKLISHSTDYQPEKRLDAVIKAISLVVKKDPSIICLVTSTNPKSSEKEKYEQLIKDMNLSKNIELLGFLEADLIPDLYASSVCYISTASGLQYGVTSANLPVKEAMACGTPAIRARVNNEDVIDGINGYMIEVTNEKELAKKILSLTKNPLKAKKMGILARQRIIEFNKWENVIDRFKQCLRSNSN